jgi:hypothetical protein
MYHPFCLVRSFLGKSCRHLAAKGVRVPILIIYVFIARLDFFTPLAKSEFYY